MVTFFYLVIVWATFLNFSWKWLLLAILIDCLATPREVHDDQ